MAHPLTWLGLLVAAIGWVMLLFGSFERTPAIRELGIPEGQVANLHRLFIAVSIILSGFAVALLGAIQEAADRLAAAWGAASRPSEAKLEHAGAPAPQSEAAEPPPPHQDVVERGTLGGREYRVLRDGRIEMQTMVGPKHFVSLDQAAEYFGLRR